MNRISVFAIIFTLFIPLGSYAQYAFSSKTPKKAGDLIESTSYNDHKRGAPRMLQYLPSGEEFVCVNGKNRYTRVATRFVLADGECMLFWNKEETL